MVSRLLKILYIALGVLAVWAFFRWALAWILPFLVAIGIARLIEPAVKWWMKKTRLPRWTGSALGTLALYGALVVILSMIVSRIFFELGGLLSRLPDWIAGLPNAAESLTARLRAFIVAAPIGLQDFLNNSLDAIISQGITIPQSVYTTLGGWVSATAGALPVILLFLITSVLSTYFISSDYPGVTGFLLRQLPDSLREKVVRTKDHLMSTMGKWLRAQGILIFITFVLLCVGFLILGIDYFFMVAALVALVDALPVVGLGLVLVPWGIFSILQHNSRLGIGLIVLYGVTTLVRSFAEPKLVGDQIGLPPILTLVAMYVGYRVIGLLGMILFPVAAITLKQLQEWGYVRLWKS